MSFIVGLGASFSLEYEKKQMKFVRPKMIGFPIEFPSSVTLLMVIVK
jgi:hypothetical protein